ncbi:Dihydrofolate reductase [Arthrobacter subterraneus]|uniref:Dihydrofolate reductase n=1 Tax=Arthrobacter subterraneus TaxID=335973 RepID=A0A1G8KSE7_9MICC|nr:dihydrofolate reductase family protein [Arthrobacter subterraneus]SDI46293.1 Dihydrofolate reductase [Arthrobacter subterraneus]
MSKIILMMSVSLDGFFEGLDRDISWHRVDDELHQYFNDQCRAMGAFMDGRVTHELMAGYWPTADQDPDSPAVAVEFAQIWRETPKFVFSRTLTEKDIGGEGWNATVLSDVVPEQIAELKAQAGGDIAIGGANLATTFLRLGLVDEIHLCVHPVVLGQGRPSFESPYIRLNLTLEGTRTFSNGAVVLRYSIERSADSATD